MKPIPVFLAANDSFAPFIATTILSILDHTKSFISFYIIDDSISDKKKEKLNFIKNLYTNFSIEYIKIDTQKCMHYFPEIGPYSLSTYSRYFIPELNDKLEKVIYSDVDVIYMDDIKKMYNIDISPYGLAAPKEELGGEFKNIYNHNYRKRLFSISKDHIYFQAGNLIIDCNYWRENSITEKCIKKTLAYKDILVCPDMDVLNKVFENDYKILDYRFSVCTHRLDSEYIDKEMLQGIKKPFCIHYASGKKPWKYLDIPYGEYWWRYARITPFYEDFIKNLMFLNKNLL